MDSVYQGNNEIIESELRKSSENNLSYLQNIISSKTYMTEKEIDIKNSHINFLNREYFSIIRSLFSKKDHYQAFNSNLPILNKMIENDTEKIKQMICDFNKKIKSMSHHETVQLFDKSNVATNYTIKETLNVREIEVIATTGNLTDVIEQDF